ncbi:hypothetical protein HDE_12134 [Halotydeus destructor]|nr:hypothetical protein HDE_12134 [Halotydeus destructor]
MYRIKDFPFKLRKDLDYSANEPWVGCRPQLCVDATLDAAIEEPSQGFIFYRGHYAWSVSRKATKFADSYLGYIDAAFRYKETIYAFHDHQLIVLSLGNVVRRQLVADYFPDLVGPVDAAFMNGSVLHIIQTNIMATYNFEPGRISRRRGQRRYISDVWKGLPSSPDAAVMYNKEVNFFKSGFLFKYGKNGLSESVVMQESFFDCKDYYYRLDLKFPFASSLKEFVTYRKQFKPQADLVTGDIIDTTEALSTETEPKVTQSITSRATISPIVPEEKSKDIFAFIAVAAVLILFAIVTAVCVYGACIRPNVMNDEDTVVKISKGTASSSKM